MPPRSSFLLAAAVACVTSPSAAQSRKAQAATVQVCLAANGNAQSLRSEGKLRRAREELKACSQPTCPGAVQRDCAQWLREVEAALPSISFSAKDEAGHDLTDVRVLVDGEVLATELAGSAIAVDPGKHVFHFERDGSVPFTQEILVNEGDKARRIDVTLAQPHTPPPAPPPTRRLSAGPFVLGGVGLAAIAFGFPFMANRNALVPDECKVVPGRCLGVPPGDPKLARAASMKNQSYVGLGVGLAGSAALAAGLTWLVLDAVRTHEAKTSLRPAIGPSFCGVVGAF